MKKSIQVTWLCSRADIYSMLAAFSLNHCLDTDPEMGACLFHKCRQGLREYLADGGDQAGFGVVGGYVLNVWPNEVVKRVQVGERGVWRTW